MHSASAQFFDLTRAKNPSILDTLGAAYASAGQFDQAVATAETAIALATEAANEQLRRRIRMRLDLYARKKPYRMPVAEGDATSEPDAARPETSPTLSPAPGE